MLSRNGQTHGFFAARGAITAVHLDRALNNLYDRAEFRATARDVGDPTVVTFYEFRENTPRGVQGRRAH